MVRPSVRTPHTRPRLSNAPNVHEPRVGRPLRPVHRVILGRVAPACLTRQIARSGANTRPGFGPGLVASKTASVKEWGMSSAGRRTGGDDVVGELRGGCFGVPHQYVVLSCATRLPGICPPWREWCGRATPRKDSISSSTSPPAGSHADPESLVVVSELHAVARCSRERISPFA